MNTVFLELKKNTKGISYENKLWKLCKQKSLEM